MAAGVNVSDQEKALDSIKHLVRCFPDFPKPGINFKDICPILKDPQALRTVTDVIAGHLQKSFDKVDVIVGLDARGFLFGPIVALVLNVPFVPVRKSGKLPGPTIQTQGTKEYGQDVFEMQADAIEKGQKVVILDDLLATGGTLKAACQLVQKAGGEVLQCVVIFDLVELNGKSKVPAPVKVLIGL